MTSAPVLTLALTLARDGGRRPTVAGLLRGGVHHLPSVELPPEVGTFHEDFVPAVVVPGNTNGAKDTASQLAVC